MKYKIELKWAVIFVVMSLAWMMLERAVGLHNKYIDRHAVYTSLIAIPAIAIYVFALLDKRRNYYHGDMNYQQGFISGAIITLIIAVLSPLTQYITSTFITPHYFTNATRHVVESGKMTQAAAEDYFNLKSYIVQGLIGAVVMGLITSAIVAFFTRSKTTPVPKPVA